MKPTFFITRLHNIFFLSVMLFTSNKAASPLPFLIKGTLPADVAGKDHPITSLVKTVHSYPATGVITCADGTKHAHQYIQNRKTKYALAPNISTLAKHSGFSALRGHDETDYTNYPPGDALFPNHPNLAAKFDAVIQLMTYQPTFKHFFNKIHLSALNELYEYLINVYTNFNLQHVGITETPGALNSVTISINVPLFLQNEQTYDTNKKTLIINHLINIIESQINGKIKSLMPNIPHLFATSTGKTLIQNDFSFDLTKFILPQIKATYQNTYLQNLGIYFDFFQEFTSYLNQPHPDQSHFTEFVALAEAINQYIYGSTIAQGTLVDSINQMQIALQAMNPPMFNFTYDDIRALKLIPHLAKSLPTTTTSIGWPDHILHAATNKTMYSSQPGLQDPHPIAYFKDSNGHIVFDQESAERLFVVIQSGANFFEEEVQKQPDWLNSWEGIAKIMAACFGDFSALIGLNILDPFMETLMTNTISTMNNQPLDFSENNPLQQSCADLIVQINTLNTTPAPTCTIIPAPAKGGAPSTKGAKGQGPPSGGGLGGGGLGGGGLG